MRILRPGQVVDGFEVLRLLGEGGFGEVYEAFEPATGRRAALKVLKKEFQKELRSKDPAVRHDLAKRLLERAEAADEPAARFVSLAIAAGGGTNYRSITREIRQRPGGNILYVFRLR